MSATIKTIMLLIGVVSSGIGVYYHDNPMFIIGHIWVVGSIVFKAD